MTTKEKAIKSIDSLPETATWADVEERVRLLAAIEKGLDDVRDGRVVAHEDVTASVDTWLTD